MNTSLPLALRSLGSYLTGQALDTTNLALSSPASPNTTITTFLRFVLS